MEFLSHDAVSHKNKVCLRMVLCRVENNLWSLERSKCAHKQHAWPRVGGPFPIGRKELRINPGRNYFARKAVIRLQTPLHIGGVAEQIIATQNGLLNELDRLRSNRVIPPVGLRFDCTCDHAVAPQN